MPISKKLKEKIMRKIRDEYPSYSLKRRKKMTKYQIGDEEFTSKAKAIERRIKLNKSIKEAGDINLVNRVLKSGKKWVVRTSSKRL